MPDGEGGWLFLAQRRRDNGRWEPPAGVLELDETPEDGVAREIAEETGVLVQVERLVAACFNVVHPLRPVSLVFRCTPIAGEPVPTDEASEARWLTRTEVLELMPEAHAVRCFAGVDHEWPVTIMHDGTNVISQAMPHAA